MKAVIDFDEIFLLFARTSVQEMIPFFVVCLMVMDLTAIWLLRE
jgi:hypothetical protein